MMLKDHLLKKKSRRVSPSRKDKENVTVSSSSSSSELSDDNYDNIDALGVDKKTAKRRSSRRLHRKLMNAELDLTDLERPAHHTRSVDDDAGLHYHSSHPQYHKRTNTNTSLLIKGEFLEHSQSVWLDDVSSTSSSMDTARTNDPQPLASSTAGSNVDMRFTLTPQERHGVLLLKAACEQQQVPYKHLFELAKYVLVSYSCAKDGDPKADEKRTATALRRIQKLRQWEAKYNMEQLDVVQALTEIQQICPDYFLTQFTTDAGGRHIVGHHILDPPTNYALDRAHPENAGKFLLVENTRMDLAAANMEEARRGIAYLTLVQGKITLPKIYYYFRLIGLSKENVQEMHLHRVKKVHAQVPSIYAHLTSVVFPMLPKKIKDRFTPYGSLDEMHRHVHLRPLPPGMDLERDATAEDPYLYQPRRLDVRDWVAQRQAVLDETVQKLKL